MKAFIRTYAISFLGVYLAQLLVGGLVYGSLIDSPFILFILALTLIEFFVFPLLKVLSLPTTGLGGLFFRTIIVGLIIYLSTSAIQGFSVTSTVLPSITIFDVNLPSKDLGPIEALLALSLTYSIISSFFRWLCKSGK
ncbi:hypothetical protein GF360_02595 [candidate division WWE3 bacterium]|nr:hypothetical protein [candidate division WWE3 bacterium]